MFVVCVCVCVWVWVCVCVCVCVCSSMGGCVICIGAAAVRLVRCRGICTSAAVMGVFSFSFSTLGGRHLWLHCLLACHIVSIRLGYAVDLIWFVFDLFCSLRVSCLFASDTTFVLCLTANRPFIQNRVYRLDKVAHNMFWSLSGVAIWIGFENVFAYLWATKRLSYLPDQEVLDFSNPGGAIRSQGVLTHWSLFVLCIWLLQCDGIGGATKKTWKLTSNNFFFNCFYCFLNHTGPFDSIWSSEFHRGPNLGPTLARCSLLLCPQVCCVLHFFAILVNRFVNIIAYFVSDKTN